MKKEKNETETIVEDISKSDIVLKTEQEEVTQEIIHVEEQYNEFEKENNQQEMKEEKSLQDQNEDKPNIDQQEINEKNSEPEHPSS